ncbi:MAG: hypothetical protein V4644_01455 [Patescibacteria group bacterium]
MPMNGPKQWPPSGKPNEDTIIDAEFEDIPDPEKVLKLTYQGDPRPANDAGPEDGMVRTAFEDGSSVRVAKDAEGGKRSQHSRGRGKRTRNDAVAPREEGGSREEESERKAHADHAAEQTDAAIETIAKVIRDAGRRPADVPEYAAAYALYTDIKREIATFRKQPATYAGNDAFASEIARLHGRLTGRLWDAVERRLEAPESPSVSSADPAEPLLPASDESFTHKESTEKLRSLRERLQLTDQSGNPTLRITDQSAEKIIPLSDATSGEAIALKDQTPEAVAAKSASDKKNAKNMSLAMGEAHATLDAEAHMGAIEARLKEQTTKFYAKENRAFRRGWDELKSVEREYNAALLEVAKSRQAGEKLSGLTLMREVIVKGEETKRTARAEALKIDDRYALEKAFGLIPKGNAWLEKKLGANKARALRAFTTAALVVGVGVGLGTFGAVGVTGLLGIGAYKGARSFVSATVGAAGGAAAGSWFDRAFGRKRQAQFQKELSSAKFDGPLDASSFAAAQKKVSKLLEGSDDRTRDRNKLIVQGLASMGLGGGLYSLMTALDADVTLFGTRPEEVGSRIAATDQGSESVRLETDAAPHMEARSPEIPAPSVEAGAASPQPVASPSLAPREASAPAEADTAPSGASSVEAAPSDEPARDDASMTPEAEMSSEALLAFDDQTARTAELNRQALEGRAVAPLSDEDLKDATPYEPLPQADTVHEPLRREVPAEEAASSPAPASAAPESESVSEAPPPAEPNASEPEPRTIEDSIRDAGQVTLEPAEAPDAQAPYAGASVSDGRTLEDSLREANPNAAPAEPALPERPEAAAAQRSIEDSIREASPSSEGSYTNAYGVEISPSVAAAYEWRVPGSDTPAAFVFGDDPGAVRLLVMQRLEADPSARVLVNYLETETASGTPEMRVGEWSVSEDGEPVFKQSVVNPQTGGLLRAADPRDFIRKLS